MVAVVIMVPTLVTGGIEKAELIDADKALQQIMIEKNQAADSAASAAGGDKEDPMKGLLDALKQDQNKK
jgi:hypothetical protein